jgi:hypothetical protein
MQKKNFEDIRFPTYGSIQQAVLAQSFTGQLIQDKLSPVLITTVSGGRPVETFAKRTEDSMNAILAPSKK